MALGILVAGAFFHRTAKRGYYVVVRHNDPEVHALLIDAFGGKIGWLAQGKGQWGIWGRENVEALLEVVQPFIRKAQWTGWLQSIGRLKKGVCSGCGVQGGDYHEKECYLAS